MEKRCAAAKCDACGNAGQPKSVLGVCGHVFCVGCLDAESQKFPEESGRCPVCGRGEVIYRQRRVRSGARVGAYSNSTAVRRIYGRSYKEQLEKLIRILESTGEGALQIQGPPCVIENALYRLDGWYDVDFRGVKYGDLWHRAYTLLRQRRHPVVFVLNK